MMFLVYVLMFEYVFELIFMKIDFDVDVDVWCGWIYVDGVFDVVGEFIYNLVMGVEYCVWIDLLYGFEYELVEIGLGMGCL